MNDELKLKNNLKEARAEKKLSQTQLTEMIGVSRNTISSIETGQFNPTAKLTLILCIALDKKFEISIHPPRVGWDCNNSQSQPHDLLHNVQQYT